MAAVQAAGPVPMRRLDPLSREVLFRQVGSLVGAVLLGFIAMATRQHLDPDASFTLVRAAMVAAATVTATVLIPWHRVPNVLHAVLPFLYLIVVHQAQAATGDASSTYAQLTLLPILWVAVYGSHLELGATILGSGVVLGWPLIDGSTPAGMDEWVRLASMLAVGGSIGWLVCRFFDQIRHQTGSLRLLAGTDPLTGCANRRAWDEELHAALVRAERDGHPLSVALVDLDDFKGFNDRNGHQAGDRLLKEVAAAWQTILRMSDVLARIGGDEFAILLPGCSLGMAAQIAERLRCAVPVAKCSVGVAVWNGVETAEQVLARADAGLYEAKQRGRGQVVILPDRRQAAQPSTH
jgi:diguanylate cyclase (GGDEF)-like protein